MTWVKAGKASEIGLGQVRVIESGRLRIALCNFEGRFYAVDDICTHDGGPLGQAGALMGAEIVCPRHGARFDVKTGAATRMPAIAPIKVYSAKVEGEDVLVEVP